VLEIVLSIKPGLEDIARAELFATPQDVIKASQ
jgi:hypothetical protein